MTISFKYKINSYKKGAKVKTPSIPITFFGNNSIPIEVICLLDSGADVSVIPEGLAKFLNINLSGKKEKSHGIGGDVEVINSRVSIAVKKDHENYEFIIPVQVILGKDEIPPLLGRNGFFDKFKITFDENKERVTLKKITERIFIF